jgi:hypothetical protein
MACKTLKPPPPLTLTLTVANAEELEALHTGLLNDIRARTKLNEEGADEGMSAINAIRGGEVENPVAERTMSYVTSEGKRVAGGNSVSKDCLGDIFLHYLQFFKMYHLYVDNYDKASELAADLLTSNRGFRETLKAKGYDGTINSLLIRPVQQLPKYRLLLERLSSLTDDRHADADRLKMAEVKCQDVATHVNEFMHKKEAHAKVLAIQASFYPSQFFAQAGRSFVRLVG